MFVVLCVLSFLFSLPQFAVAQSHSVNSDGSFSYSFPIEVPPGSKGISPKLSLTYNSSRGQGMMGIGWQLSGLPAITRVNQGQGITYSGNDSYMGPDGVLVEVEPGIYHSKSESWKRYEAQGNCDDSPCSWIVKTPDGNKLTFGATTDSRIEALKKDGSVIDGNAVRIWALNRFEDSYGYGYDVVYDEYEGDYAPSLIRYHDRSVVFHYEPREFYYYLYPQSSRISPLELLTDISIRTGTESCSNTEIREGTCGDLVRRYEMEYELESQIYRLTQIQEFGSNGTSSFQPHTFTWQNNTLSFDYSREYLNLPEHFESGGHDKDYRIFAGDFNGDGLSDLAAISPNGAAGWNSWVAMELSTGSGFTSTTWDASTPQNMRNGNPHQDSNIEYKVLPGDFNGDGKMDLATISKNALGEWNSWISMELSTGSGFTSTTWDASTPQNMRNGNPHQETSIEYQILPGDFNGDGKTDIATISKNALGDWNNWISIELSTGSGFTSTTWDASTPQNMRNGDSAKNYTSFVGDFNGDGKMDIATISKDGLLGWNSWLSMEISTGSGFQSELWSAGTPLNMRNGSQNNQIPNIKYEVLPGDFNGDGLTDIATISQNGLGGWSSWLSMEISTGRGFSSGVWNAETPGEMDRTNPDKKYYTKVGDLNGDGRDDLWTVSPSGDTAWRNDVYIELSQGKDFVSSHQHSNTTASFNRNDSNSEYYTFLSDFDGNGLPDFLAASSNTTAGWEEKIAVEYHLGLPVLITQVDNGLGGVSTIEYEYSLQHEGAVLPNSSNCHQHDTSNCGVPSTSGTYLTKRVQSHNGFSVGSPKYEKRSTRFEYYNGRFLPGTITEARHLGFEWRKVINEQTERSTKTTYFQDKPFQGLVASVQTYSPEGSLPVSETSHSYESTTQWGAAGNPLARRSFRAFSEEESQVAIQESKAPSKPQIPEGSVVAPTWKSLYWKRQEKKTQSTRSIWKNLYASKNSKKGKRNKSKAQNPSDFDLEPPPVLEPVWGNIKQYWRKKALVIPKKGEVVQNSQNTPETSSKEQSNTQTSTRSSFASSGRSARFFSQSSSGLTQSLRRTESTQKHYEYNAGGQRELAYTTKATYNYTNYDFLSTTEECRTTHWRSPDAECLSSETQYSHNASQWRLGKVLKETLLKGSTVLNSEQWLYSNTNHPYKASERLWLFCFNASSCSEESGSWVTIEKYGYNTAGLLEWTEDAKVNRTSFVYDPHFIYVKETHLPEGLSASQEYDAAGRLVERTNFNGHVQSFEYDSRGRRYRMKFQGQRLKQWNYYDQGDVNDQRIRELTYGFGDSTSSTRIYHHYDGWGRVWKSRRTGDTSMIISETHRQTLQRRQSIPYYSNSSDPLQWNITHYNALGRVVRRERPDGQSVTYDYGPGYVEVTSPSGKKTKSFFDAWGNRVRFFNETETQTDYTYDDLGRLTQVDLPGDTQVTIQYDSFGRKISMTDPAHGHVQYSYDANHNLETFTDSLGRQTTYGYDALNRLVQRTTQENTAQWFYGDPSIANSYGQVSRIEDYLGTRHYTYNDFGLLAQEILNYNELPNTFTRSFHYDSLQRLQKVQFQDSLVHTEGPQEQVFQYTSSGNLQAIEVNAINGNGVPEQANQLVTFGNYNALGQFDSLQLGKTTKNYTYTPVLRRLQSVETVNDNNDVLQHVEYNYDELGNIINIDDLRPEKHVTDPLGNVVNTDATQHFEYDDLNRLERAQGAYEAGEVLAEKNYSYDELGTMDQFPSSGVTDVEYDPNGSGAITSKTENGVRWDYEYDSENQLILVKKHGLPHLRFTYDYRGQRFKKTAYRLNGSILNTYYISDDYELSYDTQSKESKAYQHFYAGEYGRFMTMLIIKEDCEDLGSYLDDENSEFYGIGYTKGSKLPPAPLQGGLDSFSSSLEPTHSLYPSLLAMGVIAVLLWVGLLLLFQVPQIGWLPAGYRLASVSFVMVFFLVSCIQQDSSSRKHRSAPEQTIVEKESDLEEPFTLAESSPHPYFEADQLIERLSTNLLSGAIPQLLFYHRNPVSTANLITDYDGNPITHLQYTPFGQLVEERSAGWDLLPDKFTGQTYDAESGLYYYNARYYDPSLGQFLTPDTIVPDPDDPQSYNRYAYVRNNPIMFNDPTGHWPSFKKPKWVEDTQKAADKAVKDVQKVFDEDTEEIELEPPEWEPPDDTGDRIVKGVVAVVVTVATAVGFAINNPEDEEEKDVVDHLDQTPETDSGDLGVSISKDDEPSLPAASAPTTKPANIQGIEEPAISPIDIAIGVGVDIAIAGPTGEAIPIMVLSSQVRRSVTKFFGPRSLGGQNAMFKSAIQSFGNGPLTHAGRALTKHPELLGQTKQGLRNALSTSKDINSAAADLLKNMMRNGTRSTRSTGRFGRVVEFRNANGAARFSESGEFIGFLR